MKATLNFDLTDQDDRVEHLRCVKALDLASVIWDFDNFIRSVYRGKTLKPDDKEMDDFIMDEWIQFKDKHDVIIDNLIL